MADFISEHAKDVIYMSITDLADACSVCESSVFRFCKTLDLKGDPNKELTAQAVITKIL